MQYQPTPSRRILTLFAGAVAVTPLLASGAHAASTWLPSGMESVPVLINGQRLETDAVMFTRSGRSLLPMRSLFTSLGARVEWDARERAVYAWKADGSGVRFGVGEHRVQTLRMARDPFPGNWGQVIDTQPLDLPAQMMGSRIYVPLRAASEALAADVRWSSLPPTVRVVTERVADAPPVEYRDPDRDTQREARLRREEISADQERLRQEREALREERERLQQERADRERLQLERADRERADREEQELASGIITRPALVAKSLRVSLNLPQAREQGEVPLRLVIQNTGTRPVTLNFNSGQQFDFEVIQNGAVIWNWAKDRSFPQSLSAITLKPGERIAFQTTWNQMTNTGRFARPGEYSVRGYVNAASDVLRLEGRQELELRR